MNKDTFFVWEWEGFKSHLIMPLQVRSSVLKKSKEVTSPQLLGNGASKVVPLQG